MSFGLAAERERERRVWKPREEGYVCHYKVEQLAPHHVSLVERKNQHKSDALGASVKD